MHLEMSQARARSVRIGIMVLAGIPVRSPRIVWVVPGGIDEHHPSRTDQTCDDGGDHTGRQVESANKRPSVSGGIHCTWCESFFAESEDGVQPLICEQKKPFARGHKCGV